MSSLTRDPTSYDTSAGDWSATTVTTINDYPDQTTYLTHGTTAGSATWNISAPTVPAGATNISVSVLHYRYKSGAACNSGGRIKIGASYYNTGATNLTNNAVSLNTATWANDPSTSAAWTVDGANAIAAIGIYSSDADPAFRLYSVRLSITYSGSSPSASPSATPSSSPSHSPSASPSEGTPSGSPSSTPSASPSEGTPSGSPSASPSEGTPSGSPSGSPSASPSEGTPSSSL